LGTLGLIRIDYNQTLINQDYSWIETRPELIAQRNKVTTRDSVTYKKGSMRATALGKQFALAVGLANAKTLEPEK
jgi:hypothetical protein